MKRISLVLICFSYFCYTSAQNLTNNTSPKTLTKCLTCKDGMHEGINDNTLTNITGLPFSNSPSGPEHGNGNSTFGQSYILQNLCGVNYVINGLQTTTRYTQSHGTGFPTTVPIAGLPAGFVVQKAYVYYGCSYTEALPPATSVSITNPALVNSVIASTMIGDGHSVCWGETGTCTYRCDVTSAISGNGNYGINLTGFANAGYEVDGVSLIIVYVDPLATYSGNIVLWDGDMANWTGTSMTYTGSGFTACTASSAGSAFSLAGDCQNNITPNTNTDNYNGSIGSFPNNFWNTNVINTNVAACATTSTFTGYTNNTNDCWLWSMVGLYWQYTTCASCAAMTVTSTNVNPSCGNNSGSITINVVGGTAPYTYTWLPAVSVTSTATGLSAGTYQITVHDAGCNVQTISVTLVMVNLIVTDVQTNILCNGQNNGSATFTVAGGTPPYTYSWAPIVNNTASASNLSAGTYTVTIKDNNGCLNTTILTITQPPLLTATVAPTGALCNGMSDGQATATGAGGTGAYTYNWTPGGNTNAIATGLSAGTYTMTITDANGCTASTSTAITQPTALVVNVSGPPLICIGATGTLTATVTGGTSPYAYAWSSGITSVTSTASVTPLVSQNYTVTVTDANGCTASGQVTVNLGPPLVLAITGPTSMCSGMSSTICVTPTGGTGGNIYLWEPGNLTTPCITVLPTTTTIYTVSVSDNCGTTATITTTVHVNPLPSISFSADIYQGCAPLCIQFRNTSTISQGGLARYVWTFGNGDSLQSQSPIFCYPNSGSYSVSLTVTSDSGCSSTLNKANMITAYSRPNAAFTLSPQPADILAPTIQFTDKSTDKYSVVYWLWTFGDGTNATSNLQNPSHTYQDTGNYCANLVVMNAHGCTDTATNCLVINPVFNLYIPSAFTPNGDGKNDVFQAKGQYIKSFEMYVFDRWGMQLFHSTDINNGWNGTVGGGSNIAQEDTYVYKILVTDSQGKQHSYVGNVNLIK